MKINSLWISKYKNVENLTLDFNTSHLITLLVGKNGLGKSNLIEILAFIFRDLEALIKEEEYLNWSNQKDHFEFTIEYTCRGNSLKVICKHQDFQVFLRNDKDEEIPVTFKNFIKNRKEEYLPQYVIGYYSGENKRVRDIIKQYEKKQFDILKRAYRKKGDNSLFRYMFFSENFHSQLVLLSLIIYRNSDAQYVKINNLFEKYLEIEEIQNFELNFKSPDWNFEKIAGINKSVSLLTSNMQNNIDSPFWNLSGKIDKFLTALYNHHLNVSEPIAGLDVDEKIELLDFYNLTLSELYNDIKKDFPSVLDFFDAFEATTIKGVEILNDIKFKVKKKGIDIPIQFSKLSEGEQQLLSVLGLILIFGSEDCLFLLDEPDTHLNPQWQRDYVRLLDDFNRNNDNSHIIVATHSPLIVQAAEKADVFLFKKDENNKIIALIDSQRITNWRIDQVMMSEYFEIENTRPPSLDEFMKERKLLLSKTILSEEDIESLKELSKIDDVFPTGETISDVKALNTIYNIASRVNKENDKN